MKNNNFTDPGRVSSKSRNPWLRNLDLASIRFHFVLLQKVPIDILNWEMRVARKLSERRNRKK